jgi:hypothetical protein
MNSPLFILLPDQPPKSPTWGTYRTNLDVLKPSIWGVGGLIVRGAGGEFISEKWSRGVSKCMFYANLEYTINTSPAR